MVNMLKLLLVIATLVVSGCGGDYVTAETYEAPPAEAPAAAGSGGSAPVAPAPEAGTGGAPVTTMPQAGSAPVAAGSGGSGGVAPVVVGGAPAGGSGGSATVGGDAGAPADPTPVCLSDEEQEHGTGITCAWSAGEKDDRTGCVTRFRTCYPVGGQPIPGCAKEFVSCP